MGNDRDTMEIESRLSQGGSFVAFLSKRSVRSRWMQDAVRFAKERSQNVLTVWLDEPTQVLAESEFSAGFNPFPVDEAPVVVMRNGKLDWNQMDNLVVRVFHLVHENSRRNIGNVETGDPNVPSPNLVGP